MHQMFDYYAAQLHQGKRTMAETVRTLQTSSLTVSETERKTRTFISYLRTGDFCLLLAANKFKSSLYVQQASRCVVWA